MTSVASPDANASRQLLPHEILERAADLIEPEGAWLQGRLAADARGRDCEISLTEAVSFCAIGAIMAARGGSLEAGWSALELLRPQVAVGGSVARWNNAPERTQAEVVAALRDAASLARKSSQ